MITRHLLERTFLQSSHRPFSIRRIMSQDPKILSIEDLDTSDAKCVGNSHPQGYPTHPQGFHSLKVGELEEDKLARPERQEGEEKFLIRIALSELLLLYRKFGRPQTGGLAET